GSRDRGLLAAYFDRLRREGRSLVWAPSGLWEPDMAAELAEELGVLYAFDPLETEPPSQALAYARVEALGTRTRLGEETLERIAESLEGVEEAFVAIRSPKSFQKALRLLRLLGQEVDGVADEDDDDEDDELED